MERLTTDGRFAPTLWSVVQRAGGEDPAAAREAAPEQAADTTQAFFAHLIEKQLPARVEPGKGRFRSYLLTALKHVAANAHRVASAAKRGGGAGPLSIDAADAEQLYQLEPVDEMGVVYRAFQPALAREVAVKLLRSERADEEAFTERFRRVARLQASLDHPGIARVLDYGLAGDRPFLVLDVIDGPSVVVVAAARSSYFSQRLQSRIRSLM